MCEKQKQQEQRRNSLQPHREQLQEQAPLERSRSMEQLGNPAELLQQGDEAQQEWEVLGQEALLGTRLKCRNEFTNTRTDWSRGSQDMHNVQEAVNALGLAAEQRHALRNQGDIDSFLGGLTDIENKYIDALEKCSIYIKNKDAAYFPYNKIRYAAVKNTREWLRQELDSLAEIRKNIAAHPDAYLQREVSFTDLAYELQSRKEAEDPVAKLTMKDYVKVLSQAEEDSMLCRNGKKCTHKRSAYGFRVGFPRQNLCGKAAAQTVHMFRQ